MRQLGEKTPRRRQDDGRLSLLPILTDRQVGPSRFPCGWQQVANRSRLASRSVARLGPSQKCNVILKPGALFSNGISEGWSHVPFATLHIGGHPTCFRRLS